MLTYVLYSAVAVLATVLAGISIWSPRQVWLKTSALGVTAALMPAAYFGFAELLSKPKPVDLEWAARTVPEARVVASDMQEGQGIYLWLKFPGTSEPRAYVMPWTEKAARQLHDAQRKAEQKGADVRMGRPFEPSLDDDEPRFFTAPQKALPLKQAQRNSPLDVARPDEDDRLH